MKMQLGNSEPYKLTPSSAKRLLEAVIETESKILSVEKDTTCPPTHIIVQLSVDSKQQTKFEEILGKSLEKVPEIGFEGLHVW